MNSWRSWAYGGPRNDGRFKDTSFVYILRAPNNLVKIGTSKEPVHRIRKHRRDCNVPLELICLVRHPRARKLEIKLHNYFRALGRKSPTVDECLELGIFTGSERFDSQYRQYEWFWLADEDVTWLRSKTTEEVDIC